MHSGHTQKRVSGQMVTQLSFKPMKPVRFLPIFQICGSCVKLS